MFDYISITNISSNDLPLLDCCFYLIVICYSKISRKSNCLHYNFFLFILFLCINIYLHEFIEKILEDTKLSILMNSFFLLFCIKAMRVWIYYFSNQKVVFVWWGGELNKNIFVLEDSKICRTADGNQILIRLWGTVLSTGCSKHLESVWEI